ncbi:MAG: hypothetical protein JRI52_07830, partial [Deltaproteobacteria bacterium]|nr:hypothetical protein [Deltaproteobacteria bacterium]
MKKIKGGYFHKLLRIDLSTQSWNAEAISDDFILQYIGGRGFGAKLVWDNLKANDFKIDPLGEENLLVVAPGPFTGLYIPSSG